VTTTDIDARVEEYMRAPYRAEVYWDEDYWAAEFPELPGLAAAGDTWDELLSKIDDAKRSYFRAALEEGIHIPAPSELGEEVSGRLLLRLPKSLHRQVMRLAKRDGVSVNTLLISTIARELGRREVRPQGGQR
jgi:predicted RNase H-like HicB family nuclease